MKELKKKINVILLTIIVHLIAIIIMLFLKISVTSSEEKAIAYVELEFLEEETKKLEEELKEIEENEIDIDEYIANLKNTGIYGGLERTTFNQSAEKSLSEEELKAKYESDFLKEKYGENYSENNNYEKTERPKQEKITNKNTKQQNENIGHSGPALVFVELENKNRGKLYIEVPVFTCMNEGKVVINITINSAGSVTSTSLASVSPKNSDNDCIISAAKIAAKNSKFTSIGGGKSEKGKITYTFIKQ